MDDICLKSLNAIVSFLNLTDWAQLMLKQYFLCFVNTFLLLKHCKQLLQKHFCFYVLFCKT